MWSAFTIEQSSNCFGHACYFFNRHFANSQVIDRGWSANKQGDIHRSLRWICNPARYFKANRSTVQTQRLNGRFSALWVRVTDRGRGTNTFWTKVYENTLTSVVLLKTQSRGSFYVTTNDSSWSLQAKKEEEKIFGYPQLGNIGLIQKDFEISPFVSYIEFVHYH